jgi:hypothetical protein
VLEVMGRAVDRHTSASPRRRSTRDHIRMQVIVNGLVIGLSEIAYLMLLMLLVFYFFAVIALLFLKENDPQARPPSVRQRP